MLKIILLALVLVSPGAWAVPKSAEVTIIGAGLSGLATAYELQKKGIPFHILEITPRVGGRVRTVKYEVQGQQIYSDSGMEEYWESNTAVKVLKELNLPMRSDVAISSMVLDGKLQPLGDEEREEYLSRILTKEGFRKLEAFGKTVEKLVHQLSPAKPIPASLLPLKDISFAAWVSRQGLPNRVKNWIRISVECEIGSEWEKISALDGIAEYEIFLNGGEKSYRVLGGNESFTDALANKVGRANISLNKRVTRITRQGSVSKIYFLDQATHEAGMIESRAVVSTVPLYRLAMEIQIEPQLSPRKQKAIHSQTWGAYFKAHVFVPPQAEKYWVKDESTILPILSDSALGVIYDGNPDQKEKTRIISLLVTGFRAEQFNMMPQDLLRKVLTEKLEALWPGIAKEILGMEFYRIHPRAIANWPVGRSRFDDLSLEIRSPENGLHLAGDFTENSHSSGAFISAARVVRQILEERKMMAGKK